MAHEQHSCAHVDCDEYPCLEDGTIQVGSKWYCLSHLEDIAIMPNELDDGIDEFDNHIDLNECYEMLDV